MYPVPGILKVNLHILLKIWHTAKSITTKTTETSTSLTTATVAARDYSDENKGDYNDKNNNYNDYMTTIMAKTKTEFSTNNEHNIHGRLHNNLNKKRWLGKRI